MTLTFDTAKHGIDMDGEVIRIVDNPTDLTDYSVTRNEAKDISEYDGDFKPCIVVTTAREALKAAWELAHEPEDGVIPADAGYIRLRRSDGKFYLSHLGPAIDANDTLGKRRLLDPPEPKPEPWEESRYCYADGEIFRRTRGYDGVYWTRPGSEIRYYRDYFIRFSPKPIDPEGDAE